MTTGSKGNEQRSQSASDETTPLLATSQTGSTTHADEEQTPAHANGSATHKAKNGDGSLNSGRDAHIEDDDTPLPKIQIFLLCYCSLVEPVAYFSIFPFINQMIKETGSIEEEDVGFWSGMIESLFSLTQMLLMIFYGRAADRLGRKPVLLFSLAGVAVATSLFGLSKTVAQMIAFRCLAGVFAGSVVTVRAMISENCTAKTQGRAFSFYSFARNLGIFLGPLIGGALAKPAEQYPSLFGSSSFLNAYPYALPTFFTGAISLSATILAALFLRETLNVKDPNLAAKDPPLSTWEIIKSPGVPAVLYILSHTMTLGLAFTAVVPVFMFTQPSLGGLGFSPQLISIFLSIAGASQAAWILLAFPPLQRRYSTGTVLRLSAYAWPVFFILFPLANECLRHSHDSSGPLKTLFWILISVNSAAGSGVSMAFTCVQLCLNDVAPSPSSLGTLNALALTLNSGLRAVSPAMFSALFATGVRARWFDGHLVWVILVLLALGLGVAVQWLPAKAEGRIMDKKVEDEEVE